MGSEMINIVVFVVVVTILIFLLSISLKQTRLRRNQKILIITIECILSLAIPLSVNNYFLKTYPEHYEAQFIEGLLNYIITLFSLPINMVAFIGANKIFNIAKLSRVIYSILLILAAIAIQAGAIYFLDQPYTIDTQGW
jgi:hypothetical protein